MRKSAPPEERFWLMVKIRVENECWEWKKGKNKSRYPNFWNGFRQDGAHRFSLECKIGRPLKKGECALHSCDNKRCVNPAHLFAGSTQDNSKDMMNKQRKERGEQVFGSKLTSKKVLRIRQLYSTGKYTLNRLGAMFSVCPENVGYILSGKTWKHVGGPTAASGTRRQKKLTTQDILKMRKMYETKKYPMSNLSKRFKVSTSVVCRVINRKIWSWI